MSPLAEGLALAAATLVSEDLAVVAAGQRAAAGAIGLLPAMMATGFGIFAGDLLLYATGRWAAGLLRTKRERLETAASLLRRRGAIVLLLSRFVPGTRLPSLVAAGLARLPLRSFLPPVAAGIALWTPVTVGSAALAARGTGQARPGSLVLPMLAAAAAILAIAGLMKLGAALSTWRGRRLLVSCWRRLTRWEFWPAWALYPPVVARIVWLGLKHRSLTLFTAANPAIPGGGFAGESKGEILAALEAAGAPVARFTILPSALSPGERLTRALAFMEREGLSFPIVVKPDRGERGRGVAIVRDRAALEAHLAGAGGDWILQEYIAGPEFGVFYYRLPGEAHGRIFSVTEKVLPALTGDGRRTLERLILDDPRAVCMARTLLASHAGRLETVPADGEELPLVELGTHCRGAIFRDGGRLITPALEQAIDRMSRGYEGFFFGRYDLKAPSEAALMRGEAIRILELNGVTSESTDIYDPSHSLLAAWRKLFAQWDLAFEIGRLNRLRGARPSGLQALARGL